MTVVNLRYPGQYFDQESGLHYNWHRYYDPGLGRYISSDPIGLIAGLNTYGYADNNPLRWIDPEGLEKVCGISDCIGLMAKWEQAIEECKAELGTPPNENDLIAIYRYTGGTMDLNVPIYRCVERKYPGLRYDLAFSCGAAVVRPGIPKWKSDGPIRPNPKIPKLPGH